MKTADRTESRALESLAEGIDTFVIETKDGQTKEMSIYPLQLGRLAMISKRLLDLDMVLDEDESDAVKRMWQICSKQPRRVAEIIAIATLRTKEEIDAMLGERAEELLWSPTMDARAYVNLLFLIVAQSYHTDFLNAIRSVRTLRVMISRETEAERIAHTAEGPSGER